jgi:hypothetical protein
MPPLEHCRLKISIQQALLTTASPPRRPPRPQRPSSLGHHVSLPHPKLSSPDRHQPFPLLRSRRCLQLGGRVGRALSGSTGRHRCPRAKEPPLMPLLPAFPLFLPTAPTTEDDPWTGPRLALPTPGRCPSSPLRPSKAPRPRRPQLSCTTLHLPKPRGSPAGIASCSRTMGSFRRTRRSPSPLPPRHLPHPDRRPRLPPGGSEPPPP